MYKIFALRSFSAVFFLRSQFPVPTYPLFLSDRKDMLLADW